MARYGDEIAALAAPLTGPEDLDVLLDQVGDARVVMLGEASHGTHEFYAWRAAITRRLIAEKGFSFVAVEGDWPDCDRVDRSVRCRPAAPADPRDALLAFERWPTWMWANEEVVDFTRWLRARNTTVLVGFGTHRGTVVAGDAWGAPMQIMPVPPARRHSLEDVLHRGAPEQALFVVPRGDRPDLLTEELDHRAVGVVYHPDRETYGNYVPTVLGDRYDAFCWFDRSQAVRPLHLRTGGMLEPETYPSGV